jgi:exopolyphosphatase / guanosine-5'-triphosphate,3'-diphosphate pyrophosphatase
MTARASRPSTPRMTGVIDIGTNSVKLAVGYAADGRVFYTYAGREPTRIGRGLSSSGMISRDSIQRTAAAVLQLAADARRHGAVEIAAVGTYAFRAARNGRKAAQAISRHAGVPVKILTGAKEAAMVVRSVQARLRPRRDLMVLDIGGGSAELIVTRGGRAVLARSVPLGAVRLTETFLHRDPIAPDEYLRMNEHIERAVMRLFTRVSATNFDLVVSGGTATTALSMLGLERGDRGSSVKVAALSELEARCVRSTIAQRKRFRGLPPDRADIMPAGLAVLLVFAHHARKRSIRLIEGGVRDGVMLAMAEKASRSRRQSATTARSKAAARKAR